MPLRSIPLRCSLAQSNGEWPGSKIIFFLGFFGFCVIVGGVCKLAGLLEAACCLGFRWAAADEGIGAEGRLDGVVMGLRLGRGGGSMREGLPGAVEPDAL